MANEKHLEILKQGVKTWNQWREDNFKIKPDLSEATLSQANLSWANLSAADLHGVELSEAKNIDAAEL